MKPEEIKQIVKEKYSEIVLQTKEENETSCCGVGSSCCGTDYTIFSENYQKLEGYNADADLGLGCGLPTEYALLKKGDTVIDLGSGARNDCFVARAIVGDEGLVIGLDMTEAMLKKAELNTQKLGFKNVQFVLGDIEQMPLPESKADVVISNCVLNLVPNKAKAFSEIFRVLKSGGHFSISDVVIIGDLPENLKKDAEMYAGCVSGAIDKSEYLQLIEKNGFTDIQIQKEKEVKLPDEILLKYISEQELDAFNNSKTGIYSITVFAEKP